MKNGTREEDLYPENRDKTVGFKVTPTEKAEIEKFCADAGVDNVSRFIRHAVNKAMGKK